MKVLFRRFLIITMLMPSVVFGQQNYASTPQVLKTVTIDAGHGGHDPGCVFGKFYEKDINLAVALLLGGKINEAYPDLKVVYTRNDDTFVGLAERGDIANKVNSDLFISIHTDAIKNNPQANGNSTYVMGSNKAKDNLEVAKRENAVITLENDYQTKYEGYDPSSAESFIMFSLMQYAYSEQSMIFAEMVQRQYAQKTTIVDRGARQAPYLVLWRTTMPSVLTELGFISNAKDRAFLTSKEGQQKAALALFEAFVQYKTKCDTKAGEALAQSRPEVKKESSVSAKTDEDKNVAVAAAKPAAADKSVGKRSTPEFYVQLCTLSTKSDPNDAKFKKFRGRIVQKETPNGRWRCLVAASNYAAAVELRKDAEESFGGAFVVAFLDGEHIPLAQALELTKNKK